MRSIRPATLLVALAVVLATATGVRGDAPENLPAPRALGLYPPALAGTMRDQALEALAADARRRELRFLDALQPGYLFATTRVEQRDIDKGRFGPADLYDIGGTLFHLPFEKALGYGAADLPRSGRVHSGRRGGPDARSCADCHWKGGPAGAGGATDNAYFDGDGDDVDSALSRNPIALQGAGVLELLAAEMSRELDAQRRQAVAAAAEAGADSSVELIAKDVAFGKLKAAADGSLDTHLVTGIDADLVVRPFGWKGTFATVRDIVEDSLLVHLGMQSERIEANAPAARAGPHAPPDRDGDGVVREITDGQLSALTMYVAMQPLPQIRPSVDPDVVSLWAAGRDLFESVGCASCHIPSLPLEKTDYPLPGTAGRRVDLATDGAEPRLERGADGSGYRAFAYTDLRRHDMGPQLAEPRADRGVAGPLFMTAPLWGLARSGPYLHDGRAPTIEDAILAHGGEAADARARYLGLDTREKAGIRTFLTSLSRTRRIVSR